MIELLRVYQLDVSNKFRLGVPADGGYVVGVPPPNDGVGVGGGVGGGVDGVGSVEPEYDCYISAGVSTEESFTRDFIARYGSVCHLSEANCFAFDGTIQAYPVEYTDKITFFKKNIGGGEVDSDSETNLLFVLNNYSRVFLKMDIEGGEYPWLLRMSLDDLRKIKQLVIEFHGITGDGWGCSYDNKVRCLAKLAETHYIVHAHGNNHSHVSDRIPDVIELTCISKSCWGDGAVPGFNTTPLPVAGLDFPNMRWRGDYDLNVYPFVVGGRGRGGDVGGDAGGAGAGSLKQMAFL